MQKKDSKIFSVYSKIVCNYLAKGEIFSFLISNL